MFELFCKNAVIFATCFFIDTLYGVENKNSPLLNYHTSFGPLTFMTLCGDVIFNPLVSFILTCHIPYFLLFAINIPALYRPYIVALRAGILGGYARYENNSIKVYHYIYAALIGYICANMINNNRANYAWNIIIFIAMHNTMCSIYWFIICLQNGYYNTKETVK